MHTCHYRNELVAAVHECTKCRLKSNHEIAGVSPAPLALLRPFVPYHPQVPLETARPREALVFSDHVRFVIEREAQRVPNSSRNDLAKNVNLEHSEN